jgi:hypothetical protein
MPTTFVKPLAALVERMSFSPLHSHLPLLLVLLAESVLSCSAGVSDQCWSLLLGFSFHLMKSQIRLLAILILVQSVRAGPLFARDGTGTIPGP